MMPHALNEERPAGRAAGTAGRPCGQAAPLRTSRLEGAPMRCPRGRRGFTLAETMLALLILVVLTGLVAMGIPAAWHAYENAVKGSNAQVLLATTTTELRDELGLAQAVWTDHGLDANGKVLCYQSGDGLWLKLEGKEGEGGDLGYLAKRVLDPDAFYGALPSGAPTLKYAVDDEGNERPLQRLVTEQAADSLNTAFSEITYENGVFKVAGLKVYGQDPDAPMASLDSYLVEASMIGS